MSFLCGCLLETLGDSDSALLELCFFAIIVEHNPYWGVAFSGVFWLFPGGTEWKCWTLSGLGIAIALTLSLCSLPRSSWNLFHMKIINTSSILTAMLLEIQRSGWTLHMVVWKMDHQQESACRCHRVMCNAIFCKNIYLHPAVENK